MNDVVLPLEYALVLCPKECSAQNHIFTIPPRNIRPAEHSFPAWFMLLTHTTISSNTLRGEAFFFLCNLHLVSAFGGCRFAKPNAAQRWRPAKHVRSTKQIRFSFATGAGFSKIVWAFSDDCCILSFVMNGGYGGAAAFSWWECFIWKLSVTFDAVMKCMLCAENDNYCISNKAIKHNYYWLTNMLIIN